MVMFGVPGAYLNSGMPEEKFLLLKLEDYYVEIMCKVNLEFIKYVRQEGNKNVIYLIILKALDVCIYSKFLGYNLYKDTLKGGGFLLYPYEKFTYNKIINDKHCTIQWYVDGYRVTHVSENVITGVVNIMKKRFGELFLYFRNKHTFISMDIELVKYGKINIGMQSYIK